MIIIGGGREVGLGIKTWRGMPEMILRSLGGETAKTGRSNSKRV